MVVQGSPHIKLYLFILSSRGIVIDNTIECLFIVGVMPHVGGLTEKFLNFVCLAAPRQCSAAEHTMKRKIMYMRYRSKKVADDRTFQYRVGIDAYQVIFGTLQASCVKGEIVFHVP